MSVWEIFKSTMPFVLLKLGVKLIYVALYVAVFLMIIENIVMPILRYGRWEADELGVYSWLVPAEYMEGLFSPATFLVPFGLLFFGIPIFTLLLRNIIKYIVRVGHIAVLTEVAMTGHVPENQISWGMRQVKENFGRATVFFFIDRMIRSSVMELQFMMRNILAGLGPVAFVANAFKHKFLNYIDECCLAYTFACPESGPFESSVKGVVTYVHGWKNMAMAAVKTMLATFFVSLVFYLFAVAIVVAGVWAGSFPLIIGGLIFFFVVGAIKQCVLETYAMVSMLINFLEEMEHGEEIAGNAILKVASMSRRFRELVFQANREEAFLSDEEETKILQSGGGRFHGVF